MAFVHIRYVHEKINEGPVLCSYLMQIRSFAVFPGDMYMKTVFQDGLVVHTE